MSFKNQTKNSGYHRSRAGSISILLLTILVWVSGCQKIITAPLPNNQLTSSSIFLDSIPAQSAMNGVYSQFYNGSPSGSSYYSSFITVDPSRLADEMNAVQNTQDPLATNTLTPGTSNPNTLWTNSYNIIYLANSVMEGAKASTGISATLKTQLTGEAKFMRALCYFYLVNYFGDVPLVTTTSVPVNSKLGRTAPVTVYAQIVQDLTDARTTLAADYSWSAGNRTRANTWAASALLARTYLYMGRWADAETESTRVITHTALYSLVTDPNSVFLKNSQESIFSLYTNAFGYPFLAGNTILSGASTPLYAMRQDLIKAFETGDTRLAKWTNTVTVAGTAYRYPYKYKSNTNVGTEYEVVLRLGEQYLIRAEARMQQNNITGSQADLNMIRNRAGLPNTTATDVPSLKLAIEHERQTELFYEWGHRWLDLKRTARADAVLGAEKTGWQSYDALYPIPLSAISTNSNLTQNPGYH